ncbi:MULTISPECIES: 2-C-methyl-D-erythritol 4-phosphate cytidylyltransferase [Streptomycetaceae]|uniref:2-C-methyl-D-erythritol 4-phosphate cytidylyltransferase n=1 Tax=Streptomycetaceae TaxID=2062 RepID=UPI0006C3248C|nr:MULTISPECIES: 2-C-methyl-D-erythritol 4-phosphate cytidylyltransferase [Streptomycetaceae]KOV32663.1 2-C-methyl-D-erythritol 4-phosphate cytidylyltransferase [Streptomyces sp. XY431]MDY0811994.1 2-C-methyl-D-erythritol 4-phosphate cytidylyltransferase [Kitasatospora purpeofusca]
MNATGAIAAAVVPAAGRGERLGPGAPKALRDLGGVPLLVHAVRALTRSRAVGLVVVAAPADGVAEVVALLDSHGLEGKDIRVVAGGDTRQESVRLGLAAIPAEVGIVLVHDAARPLVPVEVVDAVASAVRAGAEAVVPAVPLADTVKRVEPVRGGPEPVLDTPDRATLRAVQTPQGFRRDTLAEVHAKALAEESAGAEGGLPPVTDDAGLVERFGGRVVVVPGHEEAFKVTRPLDLVLAEAVLARRRAADAY